MSRKSDYNRNKKNRIYVRDNGHCHYCARLCRPFSTDGKQSKDSATLDHVQTRAAGGGNADQNLVLACFECNNVRSCIPYAIFMSQRLWLPENKGRCNSIRRLFAVGVESVKKHNETVWLLEMYMEEPDAPISVQNWGVFASADAVHKYMHSQFPDAILNSDDDTGYIGYHFPSGHILTDVSFVANAWDLQ